MENTNRRSLLKSVGAGAGSVILAGCLGGNSSGGNSSGGNSSGGNSSGGNSSGGNSSINWLTDTNSDYARSLFNSLANEFTQKSGTAVSFEYTGTGVGLRQRLTTLIQAGSPPTLVTSVPAQEGGFLFGQDLLEPVTDVMNDLTKKYNNPPETWRLTSGGEDYMVLIQMARQPEIYRTDKYDFGEDGLENNTWDSLISQAKNVDSNNQRATVVAGAPEGMSSFQLTNWAAADGVKIVTSNNNSTQFVLNNKKNKDGLINILSRMKELHKYSNVNAEVSFGEGVNQYLNANAFHIQYPGVRPMLALAESDPKGNILRHMKNSTIKPLISESGDPVTTAGPTPGGVFILNSDLIGEDKVEAAKEFLRFVFLNMDNFINWNNTDPYQNLPAYKSIYNSKKYQNSEPFQEMPVLKELLELELEHVLPGVKAGNDIGRAPVYYGPMFATGAFGSMVNEVLIQDTPPERAFDNNINTLQKTFEETKKQLQ